MQLDGVITLPSIKPLCLSNSTAPVCNAEPAAKLALCEEAVLYDKEQH